MDRIVAVEITPEGAELFCRTTSGGLSCSKENFSPWLLAEPAIPVPEGVRAIPLSGGGALASRWEFPSLGLYENLLPELKKTPGVMTIRDLSCQFLSLYGMRLFTGMDFSELKRMQFAVIPDADGKTVSAIEVGGSGNFAARFDLENCSDEADIIAAFDRTVKEFDPDVLEGFNIFREDLPLLEKRAKKFKYPFSCGRDGGTFKSRKSRFAVAEKQISFNRYSLFGRHLADLYHLLLFYDAVHRDFDSFELPFLREYF